MHQKHKTIENNKTFQTVVDRRVQQITQQLQDDKKPRKLEEVQEGCREHQEIILWYEDSRSSKQEL